MITVTSATSSKLRQSSRRLRDAKTSGIGFHYTLTGEKTINFQQRICWGAGSETHPSDRAESVSDRPIHANCVSLMSSRYLHPKNSQAWRIIVMRLRKISKYSITAA